MPNLCSHVINSFDTEKGELVLNTIDTATFPLGIYEFEFSASLIKNPDITSRETYLIEFQDPCLHQTELQLPTGGPFVYEYTITDL